ncbi:MAG: hypothetical protein KDA24_11605 [Deltaproteobacteria bacterium]|nr:hypothetical protein [Deltaproteobacteria bacterium]
MSRSVLAATVFLALSLLASVSVAGESKVNVSVLSAPGDSAVAEVSSAPDVAPPPPGSENAQARLAVRTADTLGPSYRVTSMSFSIGQDTVGSMDSFEAKPKLRRTLREGPAADVDARGDRLRVLAVVRGVGSGDFAWLNNYEYTITSVCPVSLTPGEETAVNVVVTRTAGVMADFGEGLTIECGS